MVSKLAGIMTDFISDGESFNQTEHSIYAYGFSLIIEIFMVTIVSVILAGIMGKLKQCLVFFMTFIPLRRYGGGFHLSSFKKCFLLSVIVYETILLSATWIKINRFVMFIGYTLLLFLFIIGPVYNKGSYLDDNQRVQYKNKYRLLLVMIAIAFAIMYKKGDYLNAAVIIMTLLLCLISGFSTKAMEYIKRC